MTPRRLIVTGSLLFVALAALVLRPVPRPNEDNTYWVEGTIRSAESPCCEDIVIKLAGQDGAFYINRGMERFDDPEGFCSNLEGRPVRIRVIRHWTPLDPNGSMKSIATLRVDDVDVFNIMQG